MAIPCHSNSRTQTNSRYSTVVKTFLMSNLKRPRRNAALVCLSYILNLNGIYIDCE